MGRAYQNRKASMAKTADLKTKLYSKYGRAIYVSAKQGSPDPDANLTLRGLIDRARKDQVPAHVIEKAIDKARGAGGEDYALARYEGFGPGQIMVIVDCLTDNPNRTFGDVRLCFTKSKCKIGTPGSVSHMFDHCAVFVFDGLEEDTILETLMDRDVEVTDIEAEGNRVTVLTPHTEYANTRTALVSAFPDIEFEVDEIQFLPQTLAPIAGEELEQFEKFLGMLNDLDDVQNVYHNAELPQEDPDSTQA